MKCSQHAAWIIGHVQTYVSHIRALHRCLSLCETFKHTFFCPWVEVGGYYWALKSLPNC